MENFAMEIDLFLTEISIELLGNKIYDVNGKRSDKIINLFKALPESNRDTNKNENSNDFLCSLGYQSNFTENDKTVKEFLSEQLDFILKEANTSPRVNQDIIDFLRNYKTEQQTLTADVNDVNVRKVVEKGKLMTQLNRSRVKTLSKHQLNSEKEEALNKYYEEEKDELLQMSMDTIRLIKYIINDSRNENVKGELVAFVHAMRSVGSVKETNSSEIMPTKPYNMPRKRSKPN